MKNGKSGTLTACMKDDYFTYHVKHGDSWFSIAEELYDDQRRFMDLINANLDISDKQLRLGQPIKVIPLELLDDLDVNKMYSLNPGFKEGDMLVPPDLGEIKVSEEILEIWDCRYCGGENLDPKDGACPRCGGNVEDRYRELRENLVLLKAEQAAAKLRGPLMNRHTVSF